MRSRSPIKRSRSRSVFSNNGNPSSSPTRAGNANGANNVNLWKLLLVELNINSGLKKDETGGADDVHGRAREELSMAQLLNIVRVPIYLEKFMLFGLLYCLNSFLTLIIIVPLRILLNTVLLGRKVFLSKRLDYIKVSYSIVKRDATYLFLVCSTLLVVKDLDTSKIYHNIKNGTLIKLYVMMGILEVADKLLSSMGQDLLNIMFNLSVGSHLWQWHHCVKFVIITLLSVAYLSCHSYVFVFQIMSLTVLINSYSNALLTLILSAQFSELKSSVFKKFEREGLFQISCADLSERFQLFMILFIISLKNLNIENNILSLKPNSWYLNSSNYLYTWFGIIMGPTLVVIGSEIMVDWLKHLYITKFNKIRPSIYDRYLRVLSVDYITAYKQYAGSVDNNLDGISLVRRVGLPLLTMVVVFVKMSIIPILQSVQSTWGVLLVVAIFVSTLLVRLVLSLILLKWSNNVLVLHQLHQLHHRPKLKSAASLLLDFDPGIPSTSLVEIDTPTRKHLYDVNEKVPESLEEMRNLSILKKVAKKRDQMLNGDEDEDKLDTLHDVNRYEMASKRIW